MLTRSKWGVQILRAAYYARYLWDKRSQRSAIVDSEARSDFYARMWRHAAGKLSAEIVSLSDEFFEIRLGERRTRVHQQFVMMDDPVTLKIAGRKPLVYRLLGREGMPVPPYCDFTLDRLEEALKFLRKEEGACVVKPAWGTGGGVGVTTGVRTENELIHAAAYAAVFSPHVMVEQQVEGDMYRLLYLEGELIDAVRRLAPRVVGDGRSSIRSLIEEENRRREKKRIAQGPIPLDLDCRTTLRNAGVTLDTVLERDRSLVVKTVTNQNSENENESVLDLISEELMRDGAQAAAVLGVHLAGVDVITKDPSVSLKKSGGVINEVNTTPGLHFHYEICNSERGVNVALRIIEHLLLGRSGKRVLV